MCTGNCPCNIKTVNIKLLNLNASCRPTAYLNFYGNIKNYDKYAGCFVSL